MTWLNAWCLPLIMPKPPARPCPIGGPDCITQGELLSMIAKEAGIKATYTKGVTKEALIQRVRSNPQQSFFTAEQIQDFIVDSKIDHTAIIDLFGIEFQRVADYIRQAVPRVQAAMAGQQKK